jgi:beta-glucosidase/6-phospho-beta-glucosidase/beta-galactosidase
MAAKSFLTIVDEKYGVNANYQGDEFGGSTGHDGRGLPKHDMRNFMFATGIECSNPTINNGKVRRDLLEECGHYKYWKKDLQLVKELGLNVLRYGLPYHLVNKAKGKYDWRFADKVMNEIKRLKITPILDLMHFGVPDWVGNFQNPELPIHFANYAAAVAKRYPWVRFYTPVNEIFVTAKMSAKEGLWNEQLKTDKAFVTAIKNIVAASILATHEIAQIRPDCVIVQSESAEYLHEAYVNKDPAVTMENKLRFIALDLLYANPPDADVCMYLLDNGLTRKEYEWFMKGEPPGYQVMGNDYYGRNERIKLPNGNIETASDILGWYQITKTYYERFKKPVMHTETNVFNKDEASIWLWKQWMNVLKMRRDGVPVLGFTWYSLINQVDWDIALAQKKNNINECGLYDMDRNPNPVAAAYKTLIKEFGQITVVPYGEMFEITNMPASLKSDV